MKTYDITIRAARKGQSIYMTRKLKNYRANNPAEALVQIAAEWHEWYEGRWNIDLIRAEEVDPA